MTPELMATIFGAGISLIFKFVKPLDNWFYNVLDKQWRGLVMLGFSLLVPSLALALSCLDMYSGVVCHTSSIPELLKTWLAFVIANQGLFLMTPDSAAKQARVALE